MVYDGAHLTLLQVSGPQSRRTMERAQMAGLAYAWQAENTCEYRSGTIYKLISASKQENYFPEQNECTFFPIDLL